MKPEVSLIIPHQNDWKRMRVCLEGILAYTHAEYEVIIVDHCPGKIPEKFLQRPPFTVIQHQPDLGRAASLNLGMERARGEYIVWLSPYAVPSHRWLAQLLAVFKARERTGMAGPVTNRGNAKQKLSIPFKTISKIHRFSNQFNHSNPTRWKETEVLSGFCVLFPRRLVDEIGWLDERFGDGIHAEADYCRRVRRAGYSLIIAADTYVHQLAKKPLSKEEVRDQIKIRKQNQKYYEYKWFYLQDHNGGQSTLHP
jgi:GT2 family glycosyltransferase